MNISYFHVSPVSYNRKWNDPWKSAHSWAENRENECGAKSTRYDCTPESKVVGDESENGRVYLLLSKFYAIKYIIYRLGVLLLCKK